MQRHETTAVWIVVSVLWVLGWLAAAVGIGVLARKRNRDPVPWFLLGLLAPLMVFLWLYFSAPKDHRPQRRRLSRVARVGYTSQDRCMSCGALMPGLSVCNLCGGSIRTEE